MLFLCVHPDLGTYSLYVIISYYVLIAALMLFLRSAQKLDYNSNPGSFQIKIQLVEKMHFLHAGKTWGKTLITWKWEVFNVTQDTLCDHAVKGMRTNTPRCGQRSKLSNAFTSGLLWLDSPGQMLMQGLNWAWLNTTWRFAREGCRLWERLFGQLRGCLFYATLDRLDEEYQWHFQILGKVSWSNTSKGLFGRQLGFKKWNPIKFSL